MSLPSSCTLSWISRVPRKTPPFSGMSGKILQFPSWEDQGCTSWQLHEVFAVEYLDVDLRILLLELPHLPVLLRHQGLLHLGDLYVQIELREVEIGGKSRFDIPIPLLLKDEGAWFIVPGNAIVVEHTGGFIFCLGGKLGCLVAPEIRVSESVSGHLGMLL